MKLYHIIPLLLTLLLILNIPEYFTCTDNCHLLRDYSKWLPSQQNASNPDEFIAIQDRSLPSINIINENGFNEQASPKTSLRPSQTSSTVSIFKKNKDMLAWASVFKNQNMTLSLAESIWAKNVPAANRTSISRANKIRLEFNKEIEKITREKRSTIYSEDTEFPLEMIDNDLFVDKESFIIQVQRLEEYAEIFEILAEKLMIIIDTVFDENYTHLEGTWGPVELYNQFFKDVAKSLGMDFDLIFTELDEARENAQYDEEGDKWLFNLDTCILVARDNFGRMYYSSPLYNSHVFRFYKIN